MYCSMQEEDAQDAWLVLTDRVWALGCRVQGVGFRVGLRLAL